MLSKRGVRSNGKKQPPSFAKEGQTTEKQNSNKPLEISKVIKCPENWNTVYENIKTMRSEKIAEVDNVRFITAGGTTKEQYVEVPPWIDRNTEERFEILVSLMLSSQTKDDLTNIAFENLRNYGCTPEKITETAPHVLEEMIKPVAFYKRKATYLIETSKTLIENYDGDIPSCISEMLKLRGVGPKMAHICMSKAWNATTGIGVDTHVHRVSCRLGWVQSSNNPEKTRQQLESWMPRKENTPPDTSISLRKNVGNQKHENKSGGNRFKDERKNNNCLSTKVKNYKVVPDDDDDGLFKMALMRLSKHEQPSDIYKGSEISSKTVKRIIFGRYEFDVWYKSFYPTDYVTEAGCVSICQFCLVSLRADAIKKRHYEKCPIRKPPGHVFSRKNDTVVFKIDGDSFSSEYCRNLCLLAMFFVSGKVVYNEVDHFDFYVLTKHQPSTDIYEIIGYFSRDKNTCLYHVMSCLFVLPPFMKMGYGSYLIDLSYQINKKLKLIGTPERPLSSSGIIAFRKYWTKCILGYLKENSSLTKISIKDISVSTCISQDDVVATLQSLGMIKKWNDGIYILKDPPV